METKRYSFILRFVGLLACLLIVRANAGEPIQITAKPIFAAGSTVKFKEKDASGNPIIINVTYNSFRIPSLSRTENGILIAICEGWTNHEAGAEDDNQVKLNSPRLDHYDSHGIYDGNPGDRSDLVMRRSLDGGLTWEEPVGLIRGLNPSNGNWRAMYSNPTQVVDPVTKTVFLHYVQWLEGSGPKSARPGTTDNMAFVIQSPDDGLTWSAPKDITPYVKDAANWNSIAYGPGSGIYIPFSQTTGRLIVPATRKGSDTEYGSNLCAPSGICHNFNDLDLYSIYSDDDGDTWHRGIDVEADYAVGDSCRYAQGTENQLVSLSDGSLYLQARPAFKRTALPLVNGCLPDGKGIIESDFQVIRKSNIFSKAKRDPYPVTQDQRGVHWDESNEETHIKAIHQGMKLPQVQTSIERYTLQGTPENPGDDKNRILWTGPTEYTHKPNPDPHNLSIRMSKNEAEDFTEKDLSKLASRKLWDGVAWYSDMAVDRNKNFVGILFEAHGLQNAPAITDDTIYFTAVNRAFLEPPAGLIAWEPFTYNRDAVKDTDDGTKDGGIGWTTGWSNDVAIPHSGGMPPELIENSDLLYGNNYPFTIQGNRRLFFTSPQVTDFTLARAFNPMIDLGKTQAYYVSMLVRIESPSNGNLDLKLFSGITPGVGFGVNVARTYATNNPNPTVVFNLYTNGGNLKNQKQMDLSTGQTFMLVFKIAAAANSSTTEYVYAKAYLGRKAQTSSNGEVIPLHETIASGFGGWDVATKSVVPADMKMDRIVITTGAGAGFLIDDLRVGTTWEAVVSNQE